ncbi:MAG: ABC transporter ATP-binding protein [Polyangiaceae bacterium]|nr:ABC transporter ATP-binding protein [Polyangiaceae bacterium]MCW5789651.1 ABC transporter ATP-binding protein [Polyangiaceae bacterium]
MISSPPSSSVPVGLWDQFQRHGQRFGVGLVLLAVYQYLQYWIDTRIALAINSATSTALAVTQSKLALQLAVGIIIVALLAFVVRVLSRVVVFNAGRIAEYELRAGLLTRLSTLSPSFYRRMSTGEIMSRATNDLAQVRLMLGFGVLNAINTLFALVSALWVMLPLSVPLTFAALAPLPVLMLVTRSFSKRMYTYTRENQDAIGALSEQVQTSIAGVRVVRSFALEDAELTRFDEKNQVYLDKSLKLARLRGSFGPIMQSITALGSVIVFWYGGYLMLGGGLAAGDFLAFSRALSRLTWPLISLGFLVAMVQRGRASYSRLAEVYQAEPEITSGPRSLPEPVRGNLRVENLSFGFGDQPILSQVSFTLEPGRSLAVVGKTGSGKSTLGALLARLYPTPQGAVFLDDVDICELPLAQVRGWVAYAQQDAFLFSTTARRNIGFVLDEPDSKPALLSIRQAAAEAQVLDELLGLPDGLDTVVGERGVQLSGGQKQRVALARALISSPKLLILDDPLSAVDGRTEKLILEAIDRQRSQRGVVLITHRVAAAARCDQILVLDGGRVVEQGTHEELSHAGGLYASFVEEQRVESELAAIARAELELAEAQA